MKEDQTYQAAVPILTPVTHSSKEEHARKSASLDRKKTKICSFTLTQLTLPRLFPRLAKNSMETTPQL